MKLVVMNCKNCNAPLHLVDGKLVCEYCNSVTDIPKDSSDEAFERVANAEEYIRRTLDQKKENLQKYYQEKEAEKLEKEANEEKLRKARRLRSTLKSMVKVFVTLLFIAILVAVLIHFANENVKRKEKEAAERYEEMMKNKPASYRLTKTELLSDGAFAEESEKMALEYLKEDHSRSIYQATDDGLAIWSMEQEPELLSKYLITTDRGNGLYFFYKVILETGDGKTMEGYDCVVIDDVHLGKSGKIESDGDYRIHNEKSNTYDFYFGLDFDYNSMMTEIVELKKISDRAEYFVYEL